VPCTRQLPNVEAWLDESGDGWSFLSDAEYKEQATRLRSVFQPLVEDERSWRCGHRAVAWLPDQLPAPLLLLSGIPVPRLAGEGGGGPASYLVSLQTLDLDVVRAAELIVISQDYRWCCVFTHESGSLVHEELFAR